MPATQKPLVVHAWPQSLQLAVDELHACQRLTVISVPTPVTTSRLLARNLIRAALCETLAVFLGQPAASVRLVSHAGRAIRVDALPAPLARLHVSLSHAPGMSVAAIGRGAAVGVDVMHVQRGAEGMSDWARVALDYLGPTTTVLLQRTSPEQLPAAFAQAWTRFEACLKCVGLALTEWTPVLEKRLASCRVMALALPENSRGSIAIGSLTLTDKPPARLR